MKHIIEELRELDTGDQALENFGYLVGGILVAIGAVLLMHDRAIAWVMVAPGLTLGIYAVFDPTRLRLLYRLWMGFAIFLGTIMGGVIMITLFYGLVTPLALLRRLFGPRKKEGGGFWKVVLKKGDSGPEIMERLY